MEEKKKYLIYRRPHGYFRGGGVQDADIFPTITARTGDADNDVIMELYGQETDKTPRNEGQRD